MPNYKYWAGQPFSINVQWSFCGRSVEDFCAKTGLFFSRLFEFVCIICKCYLIFGAQSFIMALGLFWDIVTGLPWTPNGVGSLGPRGYCIFLPGAHHLTINSPYGADSSLNKLLLLLLIFNFYSSLQRLARSTSQAPLFHSQPRSNSLGSLSTSLFHSTPTSLLYLNHVSITFAPFATSDQFLVKAPPISSPALLSLPGLDYANACLFGISSKNLSRIQRIQNTLARVVTFSRPRSSTAPLLKHLHWLPVSARINFKIALLTFKSLHAIAPSYLSSLVRPYVPSRALRSSSAHQLCVPHVSTVFGSRGFRAAGPVIWNGRAGRSQSRRAPLSIPSRNNLRLACLLQPSPLVELSSMYLWFDDLHLFVYLVVLDFVRA